MMPSSEWCKGEPYPPGKNPCKGCPMCCDTCNYDMHICQGCGTHINHGASSCKECTN